MTRNGKPYSSFLPPFQVHIPTRLSFLLTYFSISGFGFLKLEGEPAAWSKEWAGEEVALSLGYHGGS